MAATPTTPLTTSQNIISGKVTVKETGAGIPDLVVVLYDIDPGEENEEFPGEKSKASGVSEVADRIGSVLTEADGSWSIIYDDASFQVLNPTEKRPDVQLMVFPPEDADQEDAPEPLFTSKVLRANSGRTEAYMIRIPQQALENAGIPVPAGTKEETDVTKKVDDYLRKKEDQRNLRQGIRGANQIFNTVDKPYLKDLRDTVKRAILPNAEILNSMYNFVSEGQQINEVQGDVFQQGTENIDNILNLVNPGTPEPGKGMKISVFLNAEDKDELTPYAFTHDGQTYYNVPESKIQEILFKRESNDGLNAILFSNNPISKFCMQKSAEEKCAELHTGITPPPDPETPGDPEPPVAPTGITSDDIPFYLEKVLQSKDSNQFQNNGEAVSARPNAGTVQANINAFSLQKGPADTTAFYDFHSLQIAFQHVWHQLLDETLVNLSEKIHVDQENNGQTGIIQKLKDHATLPGLQALLGISEAAMRNESPEVPTDIAAAFDISLLEYDALSNDNKAKLLQLAKK